MATPAFINLWNNYPTEASPCDGPWDHQCAIRMSVTLNAEQTIMVNDSTYSEPKCGHGHARGAQSLADWLWKRHLGRPKIYSDGAKAKRAIATKTGVVFFKNCFIRTGATRDGDHIDLWMKGQTKTYSDPGNKSEQVWFWELQ